MLRIERQPLAVRVADKLKQEISRGAWQEILPSEQNLSSEMGVSRTTLRRSLSLLSKEGWLKIHQGSPTRILKKSETEDGKKSEPTHNIGILSPCPLAELKHYALYWVDELRSILHELNYGLHLQHGKVYFRQHTGKALHDLIKSQPADCWILSFTSPYIQRWFQENKIPTIVQGWPANGVDLPFVAYDNKAVMFHALGQLTGKGHRNIALVSDNSESAGLVVFENTFLETCRNQGHRGIKGSIIKLRDSNANTAKNTIRLALKRKDPPTALVVINSLYCMTALTSLPRWGYRIPDDISLITTFGDPSLEFLNPVPANYVVPYQQMAKKIADLALNIISGVEVIQKKNVIMPKPVKGESIAGPRDNQIVE